MNNLEGTIFQPTNLTYEVGNHRFISTLSEEYVLITDSREVNEICASIGIDLPIWASLFVLVGDGEYLEVWGCSYSVPNYTYRVYRIA